MADLTKPVTDKIFKVRKVDNEIGALLSDLSDFVINEDYGRAVQAAAHLLIALAFKAGTKPFTVLRAIYRA